MNQPDDHDDDHVTRPSTSLTFFRPVLPDKTRSRGGPTLMSFFSETPKRKVELGDATTGDLSKIIKKVKGPAYVPSASTTLSDGTAGIHKTLPGSGSLEAIKSSVPSLATPQYARRPATGILRTSIQLSSSIVDLSSISPPQSSSHRSDGGPNAQDSPQTQVATRSNGIKKEPLSRLATILKHELYGGVYLHKEFFKEFLPSVLEIQNRVLKRARDRAVDPTRLLGQANYVDYDNTQGRWTLGRAITNQNDETKVHEPLVAALNVIGKAAFEIYQEMYPNDTIRKAYSPFINHSARTTRSDTPSDGSASPDLLQGITEDGRVHWGDAELVIECKSSSQPKHRNEAYMQLAHYARAVFAHQIYRIGVFGLSFCSSIVNFVRFDRSGMLHSPDINLRNPDEADQFVKYIINLITLDARNYGYDDRFSFEYNTGAPQTLFRLGNHPPQIVNEILCYRKCCCGRATCVTDLGEGVLKLVWRPEHWMDEGVTMSKLVNVFGFCQLKETSCDINSTRLKHPEELECSAATKFFSPEPRSNDSTTVSRINRIQSNIFMQRGTPLSEAQNPLHLVMAIHDALLGIMALTEVGKLHCDISAYNILLIDPKKHYPDQNWLADPKFTIIPEIWNQTARQSSGAYFGDNGPEDQVNKEYKSPRLKRVMELRRGPYCVLHDTEFMIDAVLDRKDNRIDRTGTPAFVSAQLLTATAECPIFRTFMHDIESLFWVLFWVLIHRTQVSDGPWTVNEHAKQLIQQLSNSDMTTLGAFKRSLIKSSTSSEGLQCFCIITYIATLPMSFAFRKIGLTL
ncbi:unnamed protein product [Rhizoctonia solani]|uniref:Fungal-type protein kinase domain-containing protein n=1 Tax=Rhizoctonia solani TaxID=456999 RepID=A0A8H3H0P7_9AGAM|nr:unnamed protein product [Rhizoctonia solani]